MKLSFVSIVFFAVLNTGVFAGNADVENVSVEKIGAGTFSFSVTVRHADSGWDHYANKWDISGIDGTVYGTRVLLHPHENEQPFARSLGAVEIPAGVNSVIVRAYDGVHGAKGVKMTVDLPK